MIGMLKLQRLFIVIVPLLLLSLIGCLDNERLSVKINLDDKTVALRFIGIASTAQSEQEIQEDFRKLITDYQLGKGEADMLRSAEVVSKEFYAADNRLNAAVLFSIAKDEAAALSEMGITRDSNGDYIVRWNTDEYVRGNAIVTQKDGQGVFIWPKGTKIMEYEVTSGDLKNKITTNLLPHWLAWKGSGRLDTGPAK